LEGGKASERLLQGLLALCGILFAIALASGIYAYWSSGEVRKAKSLVMGPQELMERLMKGRASDECARPHTISDIGFVLNPAMERCTLWVDEDQPYDVNSLGLRGEEIRPPDPAEPRRTRILVVGDSWVWGWKQSDDDRLTIQLAELLREGIAAAGGEPGTAERYEFLSVSMPAWNVISEHAFLEAHFARLQPDQVIWVMTQNDVIDIAGVIPPGVIAHSLSAQVRNHAPFEAYGNTLYPMPFIRERWERNIQAVNGFQARYGIPVVGMFVHMSPGFVSYVTDKVSPAFPVFMDPPLIRDPRWNVAEGDVHPSPWATRAMALAFLDALSQSGALPMLEWPEGDLELIEAWPTWTPTEEAARALDSYTESWAKKTPWVYPEDNPDPESDARVWMQDRGVLFVNVEDDDDHLALVLKVDQGLLSIPRAIRFRIRGQTGEPSNFNAVISSQQSEFGIPLPTNRRQSLMELTWQSDFLVASAPDQRNVAEVVSLEGVSAE
jgi:hypothetical protein